MSSTESSVETHKSRVIAYIDGFNLYYGLKNASKDSDHLHLTHGGRPEDCLGRSLYWLDVQHLIHSVLRNEERCDTIKYFTAPRLVPRFVPVPDPQRYIASNARQSVYLDALRTMPKLKIIMGWYSENNPIECARCGHQWPSFEEKVTDVNIATHMLSDAHADRFDRALLLSADADLTPAVGAVRDTGRSVKLVLAPGRKRAKHLIDTATHVRKVSIKFLRDKTLPAQIDRPGLSPLHRPKEWAKPRGWVWRDPAPLHLSRPS